MLNRTHCRSERKMVAFKTKNTTNTTKTKRMKCMEKKLHGADAANGKVNKGVATSERSANRSDRNRTHATRVKMPKRGGKT